MKKAVPYSTEILKGESGQRTFTGDRLTQIAMPLGGIGAGCICLNGYGGLQDFSIRHQPSLSVLPDKHMSQDTAFALLHLKGLDITRLLEGPLPVQKIYNQGLRSQGHSGGEQGGFPRFRECVFTGEYPFGYVTLSDRTIPLKVRITGFNPFIPLNVKDSAIPCVILEYQFENISDQSVEYEFSYHLSHLAPGADERQASASRNSTISGRGVLFNNGDDPVAATYGSASLVVAGYKPQIKAMWFRGGWFDSLSALWKEVSTGSFQPNDGQNAGGLKGRNGGSILLAGSLKPGEKITYPIIISWYFPNVPFSIGGVKRPKDCGESCGCNKPSSSQWRPYYVSQWKDARQVADYVVENYARLRGLTQAFHDALFSSTLPAYVLDAVSANLAIIKSPTVLLQENGNMWAWEGCFSDLGCCHGTCTHVWNYAQAIPHLFPQLERTLREQELMRSMDERGHINFRSALPDGPTEHTFHAASDGQLGGIMKVYREWQISGDRDWLLEMYPLAKRSLDYGIATWDPKHQGVLEEPHHNTYDIEFWGPDGMCSSFYIGALAAMAALAKDSGHPEDAPFYLELARKGAQFLDEHLFNGEYYQQKVKYEGLVDTSFKSLIATFGEEATPEELLLKKEGPKYQYGSGCISDGVLGAWLATLCKVSSPQTPENIKSSLKSIFEYNFKDSLWEHANPQRPGYALGDEPGLLLCTWPRGNKPTLPFVYSDEVWTGIEYQVASHLISQGLVDEGLTIVKAARCRYDGDVRNPWNEYECGNYYARAMSSYALLWALSGASYSAVTGTLSLAPKLPINNFTVFLSTASGWGTITLEDNAIAIQLVEGELQIDELSLTLKGQVKVLNPGITARAGERMSIHITER